MMLRKLLAKAGVEITHHLTVQGEGRLPPRKRLGRKVHITFLISNEWLDALAFGGKMLIAIIIAIELAVIITPFMFQ